MALLQVTERHNSLCVPLDGNFTSKNNNDTFSNNQQPHLTLAIEFLFSFRIYRHQCSVFNVSLWNGRGRNRVWSYSNNVFMSVVARNALPYLKWWPHDEVATQILLHCNLKLLFIVYTPMHCGSGKRKWILHKFFTHNFSSLFAVATRSLFRITLWSYFYNVTNLFVLSFAFGIKIHMLTIRSRIRLIMHHIIKSSAVDRGCIYQMKLFESEWKRIKDTTNRNWKCKKKIRREYPSIKWVASCCILI